MVFNNAENKKQNRKPSSKKELTIDITCPGQISRHPEEHNIPSPPSPYPIPGSSIECLPSKPKNCKGIYEPHICHSCPYNVENQATLFEFDKLVDCPTFLSNAFVGVLGTDNRVRCSIEENNK